MYEVPDLGYALLYDTLKSHPQVEQAAGKTHGRTLDTTLRRYMSHSAKDPKAQSQTWRRDELARLVLEYSPDRLLLKAHRLLLRLSLPLQE